MSGTCVLSATPAHIEQHHRPDVGEIDGADVADDDGADGCVPRKARTDDADVDAIAGSAEQVPAETERVGQERNDVLALHQQEHEVVRHVVADDDGDQREGEVPARFRARPAGRPRARS